MTETTQSMTVAENKQAAVATSDTTAIAREIASRLKFMIVNGNKLADQEVYALAQYSAANDLNPFAAECYYLPGTGPVPGIAGWRKKAQEQLDWECQTHGMREGGHIWVEYRPAKPDEATFDPSKGDIAEVCILHDWLSNTRWRRAIFETMRQLSGLVPNAYEEAQRMVGAEPVWSAVGVVAGSESFSGNGKPEKFDRHERARKRAEKLALRKRFPRVNLPEPNEYMDAEPVQVFDQNPAPTRSLPELQSLWGDDEPAQTPAPAKEEVTRPWNPEQLRQHIQSEAERLANAPLDSRNKQSVAGCLDYLLMGKGGRLEFLTGLFQKPVTSLNDLPSGAVVALYEYIKPYYDENATVYMPAADVQRFVSVEVTTAHTEWLKETGQQTLFG